jgi:phosphomevalonate kinase
VLLSSPGKLFLAGEYAVLERGRPALVLAVDRALHAALEPSPLQRVSLLHAPTGASCAGTLRGGAVDWEAPVPPMLRFAVRALSFALRLCAEEGLAEAGFSLTFLDDLALPPVLATGLSPKLGLGGSAASSVLSVRAACLAQGRALGPEDALSLALAAHWLEQRGSGSGGDVAASALGGALEVRVRHSWASIDDPQRGPVSAVLAQPPLETKTLRLPAELRLLLTWSGASSDTRTLVQEVRAFAAEAPGRWGRLIDEISFAAEGLRDALGAAQREHDARVAVLAGVRRAAAAMASLGDETGCPIMTPGLMHICAIASANGAAAKPSGAGGGDCAIVLCFGDRERAAVRLALEAEGFLSLPVTVAPRAV